MRTWIPTRFGRISAELTGNGPTLFLLHANPGDSLDYEAVVPALANHFLVVAVDWPGYGQSVAECPERMSAMAFADALEDITGELGTQPAWIIGNSVGGYAACRLAIRRPERVGGLVLVNTGGFTSHTVLSRIFCRLQGSFWFNQITGRRLAGHYLRARNPVVERLLSRAKARQGDRPAGQVSAAVWRSFLATEHDLRIKAAAIIAPTLLCWGRHDFLLPLATDGRSAQSCIPRAQLCVFETGHAPFAEAPEAFLDVVQPFLLRHLYCQTENAPTS